MKISMRNLVFFAGVLCLLGSAACAQKGGKKGKAPKMKTDVDSVAYIIGSGLGKNIRQAEMEGINPEIILAGIIDGLESDSTMLISQAEGNQFMQSYQMKLQKQKSEASLAKANEYMEELAASGTLESTESGILYEVVEMGDGAKPAKTDKVKVNYEGKTTDGTIFDSSYQRGTPAEFPLNRVIPGWTEILQEMPVGSTWIATIPPSLAYGERGSPPKIGPNEVLIFKIELIDIITEE